MNLLPPPFLVQPPWAAPLPGFPPAVPPHMLELQNIQEDQLQQPQEVPRTLVTPCTGLLAR